jgi:twitching motility protein PilI
MTANTTFARLQQLLPQLFQPSVVTGEPYLRFQLTPEIPALLSMDLVREALLVPANAISPLPNLPAFTIGIINARDRVFCVVDLAQLLGVAAPLMNLQEYQVVVVDLPAATPIRAASNQLLGLAVNRVLGMARLSAAQLQPVTGSVPELLTPYLSGCVFDGNERILAIDTQAIVNSPLLSVTPAVGPITI